MIASIRGTVAGVGADNVVIEVGGLGLRAFCPTSTLSRLGGAGATVSLHTYLHVREDALQLYGFGSPGELSWFELLLSITGVGPRLALQVLSVVTPEALHAAIAGDDASYLTQVPGIGRKMAARIVLELREKAASLGPAPLSADGRPGLANQADVVAALQSLGYGLSEAQAAARTVPGDVRGIEEQVRLALRHLAGGGA